MSVTLAQIEQEVAPRLGPYRQETAASGTTTTCIVPNLQSTIDLNDVENLYLLRRGKKADGSAVPGFVVGDRQRLVKTYTATTGTLEVDRPWTNAPIADEVIELHSLDPAGELRPCVQDGLRRCFFVDRALVSPAAVESERDITALLAWITSPGQIYEVEWNYVGSLDLPVKVTWWKAFSKLGHIWLQLTPDPYPNQILVTARRPVATYVNGADSTTGPTADNDTVEVDLYYAAAAAHIEAWRQRRYRLLPGAQAGLFMSQQEAANEFTKQAAINFRPPAKRTMMSEPFGSLGVTT